MAWSDLSVSPEEVAGHAKTLLTDRQSGQFDPSDITPERTKVARGHLEDVLMDEGGLAQYVDDKGGPDALLDALEAETSLQSRLQRGMALSFLAKFAEDVGVISGGRTSERADRFQEHLEAWARSFGAIAPHEIGTASTTSQAIGGGLTNSYDRQH